MNLLELLQQNKTYSELKDLALVFNSNLKSILETNQASFESKHKVSPVELTDGNFMLCADLLTEIGNNGLYAQGFGLLNQDLFSQVNVISMEEATALLPTANEEIIFS